MIDLNKAFEIANTIPATSENLELAKMCREFGQRPSSYQGIEDMTEAAAFDLACFRMLEAEKHQHIQKNVNAFNNSDAAKRFGKIRIS